MPNLDLLARSPRPEPPRRRVDARAGLRLVAGWLAVLSAALLVVGELWVPAVGAVLTLVAVLGSRRVAQLPGRSTSASPWEDEDVDGGQGRGDDPRGTPPVGPATDWDAFDVARQAWEQASRAPVGCA